jgi:hypothetical protein
LYLYLILDLYSRKIVGFGVHDIPLRANEDETSAHQEFRLEGTEG